MNKWKEVKLTETGYRMLLHDSIGLIDRITFTVSPVKVVGKNNIKLYYCRSSGRFNNSEYALANAWSDHNVAFNTTFYTKGKDGFKKAIVSYYLVKVSCQVISPQDPKFTEVKVLEFKVKNEKEFDEIKLTSSEAEISYSHPIYSEMTVGESYFYYGKGKCILKELYDYPNHSKNICKLVTSTGQTIKVQYGDKNLCLDLKAEKRKSTDIFNECLSEVLLQPMLVSDKSKNIINLIWQPVAEASNYVIKLYRIEENNLFGKHIYCLRDYYVERRTHILSINDLIIDNKYVFVVIAENRGGDIIAKSRGICATNTGPSSF